MSKNKIISDLAKRIEDGEKLTDEDFEKIREELRKTEPFTCDRCEGPLRSIYDNSWNVWEYLSEDGKYCSNCKAIIRNEKIEEQLSELKKLPVEERLERIERMLVDRTREDTVADRRFIF